MPEPLLSVSGVGKRFGGFQALQDVSLDVEPGEIVGLIGPNGSGKTTLINLISGVLRPDAGDVRLAGRSLAGLPPHRRAAAGINRTFQIPKPFASLTVRQNLEVAAVPGADPDALLARVGLHALASRRAGELTSVGQKLLDLARALATRPRLLLADELACGLNPAELAGTAALLRSLAADGMALLVVEHLMSFIEEVTARVVVMNAGRIMFSGRLREAAHDPRVVEVFLGSPEPVA